MDEDANPVDKDAYVHNYGNPPDMEISLISSPGGNLGDGKAPTDRDVN